MSNVKTSSLNVVKVMGTSDSHDTIISTTQKEEEEESATTTTATGNAETSPVEEVRVSEQGASQLMQILLERGYFGPEKKQRNHEQSNVAANNQDDNDDDDDTTIVVTLMECQKPSNAGDRDRVVTFYMTLSAIDTMVRKQLKEQGRLTVDEAVGLVGLVDRPSLTTTTTVVIQGSFQRLAGAPADHVVLVTDQTECLHGEFVRTVMIPDVIRHVHQAPNGKLLLSHIAHTIWKLSMEDTLSLIQQFLLVEQSTNAHDILLRTQQNGAMVLVTQHALHQLRAQVWEALSAATVPISLERLCKQHQWDHDWVMDLIHHQGPLPGGHVKGDQYIPDSYVREQRRSVRDLFGTQGFVTSAQCHAWGVSTAQMKSWVLEQFREVESSSSMSKSSESLVPAGVVVLKDCVVHHDVVVAPLQAAVEETVRTGSWMDLTDHLAPELLLLHTDANALLQDHVLARLDDASATSSKATHLSGIAVISQTGEGGLFVSQTMMKTIANELLPPLFEDLAKETAKQLDFAATNNAGASMCPSASTASHDKRKSSKRAQKLTSHHEKTDHSTESSSDGLFPFAAIVLAVSEAYPDLPTFDNTELADTSSGCDGILAQFCQAAFNTEAIRSAFANAVQAELKRLESDRASKSRLTRKDAASKVQTVEVAFEDPTCFANACYMIQGMAAFLDYVTEDQVDQANEITLESVKQDFLQSCCAAFTARITQYCIFKNEIDESVFSFERSIADSSVSLLHYCSPVDLAARQFGRPFLSCRQLDENGQPRDPLKALRSLLPATVGTNLARQWKLCGGECYQGGTVRSGDLAGFLKHVEENTLTICGLPFKKLDKKIKKQLLHNRRQQMIRALHDETDPSSVLDLAVMVLYQLVKNHIVFGSHLRGFVLDQLKNERKFSVEASEALLALASELGAGNEVDIELIDRVRSCALGRG